MREQLALEQLADDRVGRPVCERQCPPHVIISPADSAQLGAVAGEHSPMLAGREARDRQAVEEPMREHLGHDRRSWANPSGSW